MKSLLKLLKGLHFSLPLHIHSPDFFASLHRLGKESANMSLSEGDTFAARLNQAAAVVNDFERAVNGEVGASTPAAKVLARSKAALKILLPNTETTPSGGEPVTEHERQQVDFLCKRLWV